MDNSSDSSLAEMLLSRRPLKEDIFEVLHQRVIAGKYRPGEWLRQEDIASQLRVSQTPVREALDLLVSAGLAERVPYRGVRVIQLSTEEILDAYAMRLLLESAAAHAAARSIAPDQVAALCQILEQTKAFVTLNEMSQQRRLNRQFHLQVVEAAGNRLLSRQYQMALNTFPDWLLYEYMFRHPELLEASLLEEYQEHRAIVDALTAGDASQAAAHTITHLRHLGKEFEEYLGIPGDLLRSIEQQIGDFLTNPAVEPGQLK